ncbi:hypothetical protein STVA_47640 [Allostella vacuolata]|nr:hypothetical protein STVA_47640 [Stella vacuolata]
MACQNWISTGCCAVAALALKATAAVAARRFLRDSISVLPFRKSLRRRVFAALLVALHYRAYASFMKL